MLDTKWGGSLHRPPSKLSCRPPPSNPRVSQRAYEEEKAVQQGLMHQTFAQLKSVEHAKEKQEARLVQLQAELQLRAAAESEAAAEAERELRGVETAGSGERVGGAQREPCRVERPVQRSVPARDRTRGGMIDHLADLEVLEEVAGVRLGHSVGHGRRG